MSHTNRDKSAHFVFSEAFIVLNPAVRWKVTNSSAWIKKRGRDKILPTFTHLHKRLANLCMKGAAWGYNKALHLKLVTPRSCFSALLYDLWESNWLNSKMPRFRYKEQLKNRRKSVVKGEQNAEFQLISIISNHISCFLWVEYNAHF